MAAAPPAPVATETPAAAVPLAPAAAVAAGVDVGAAACNTTEMSPEEPAEVCEGSGE